MPIPPSEPPNISNNGAGFTALAVAGKYNLLCTLPWLDKGTKVVISSDSWLQSNNNVSSSSDIFLSFFSFVEFGFLGDLKNPTNIGHSLSDETVDLLFISDCGKAALVVIKVCWQMSDSERAVDFIPSRIDDGYSAEKVAQLQIHANGGLLESKETPTIL